MTDQQTRKPGDFCWVELATSDLKSAKNFYQAILNWQFEDTPMPQGGNYTMIKTHGTEIAGAYQITPEFKEQGVKPTWASYVLVEDVDTTTERARGLGATVYKEPFDVMEVGRMAVLADPTGAAFCLWQPKQGPNKKTTSKNETGTIGWNELATNDTEKAAQFYIALFGWQQETQEVTPEKTYTTFTNNGTPVAGMIQLTEEWKGALPHWGVYFSVSDIDKAIATATKNAGTILYDPIDAPNVGRFTMIRDPQGVHFSIIQFASSN